MIQNKILTCAIAFIKRDLKIERSYKFSFLTRISDGILKVIIFYFISRFLSPDYFSFVFVGLMFSKTLQFFLSVFTDFLRQEQYWKTIEQLFLSPHNDFSIFFVASAGKFFIFFLEFSLYAVFGFLFLYKLKFLEAMLFMLIAFFTFIIISAAGIFSASFVLKLKRGDPVNWLFSILVEFLSGVYFPTTYLPGFLKDVAPYLPTTMILNLWRNVLIEQKIKSSDIFLLVCLSIILIFISGVIFNKCWQAAKKRGDMGHY